MFLHTLSPERSGSWTACQEKHTRNVGSKKLDVAFFPHGNPDSLVFLLHLIINSLAFSTSGHLHFLITLQVIVVSYISAWPASSTHLGSIPLLPNLRGLS